MFGSMWIPQDPSLVMDEVERLEDEIQEALDYDDTYAYEDFYENLDEDGELL